MVSYLKLLICISVSGFVLLVSDGVLSHVIALGILVFGAMRIARFDLAHPYVWYSFVFMLYAIGYPILYSYGLTYDIHIYTKELMFSQWLALVVFLIAVSPAHVDYSNLHCLRTTVVSSKPIMGLASLVLLATALEISTGGYSHKGEIYSSGGTIVSMGFRVALVFLMLYAVNLTIQGLLEKKLDMSLFLGTFGITGLITFFSGERDLLIRFSVISLFVYHIVINKGKFTRKTLALGLGGLVLVPLLKKYKYFGLSGQTSAMSGSLVVDFFTSDFVSASKNMQTLLLDVNAKGTFAGATWLSTFVRLFGLDVFFSENVVSAANWYNMTYFPAGRAGQGFTLVGDGYVNFGYAGIVILFLSLGMLVGFLFRRSRKGVYSFVYYVMSIPVFMYSVRADLANVLLPLIRQNLIIILLLQVALRAGPVKQPEMILAHPSKSD
jgi:oligosaccharide repeat unit polymerase